MHQYLVPLIPLTLAGAIFFRRRMAAYGFPMLLILVKIALTVASPLYFFTGASLLVMVYLVRQLGLQTRLSLLGIAGASAGAVLIHQIFSGFGVWVIGGCAPHDPPLYAHTAAGLLQCYIKALPYAIHSFLRDVPIAVLLIQAVRWVEQKAWGARLRSSIVQETN